MIRRMCGCADRWARQGRTAAIGVLCLGDAGDIGGPNPRLTINLPDRRPQLSYHRNSIWLPSQPRAGSL